MAQKQNRKAIDQGGASRQARPKPAAGRRKVQRRAPVPWMPIAVTVVLVAVVIVAFFVIRSANTTPQPAADTKTRDEVVAALQSQSPDNLNAVKLGSISPSSALKATPAGSTALVGPSGHPEVLYIGAEYCPYCAAQRWSLLAAMARFGTFSGVNLIRSSSTDVYPNTATLTFYKSTYTSSYVDFVPVEFEDGQGKALQAMTPDQKALFDKYNPQGGVPFIDFGNRWLALGPMYSPDMLGGKNWTDITDALNNPSSTQAQAILGATNLMTAEVCKLDGDQPGSVCGTSTISAIEGQLPTQ